MINKVVYIDKGKMASEMCIPKSYKKQSLLLIVIDV